MDSRNGNFWRLLAFIFVSTFCEVGLINTNAQTVQTNIAVTVLHGPSLNGGTIQGSLQELNGESPTLNSGFTLTGDLLFPGTPTLHTNGSVNFQGVIVGTGSNQPSGYSITLNSGMTFRYLRTHVNPVAFPTVAAPPQPSGTRNVILSATNQSPGDFNTLCNLTLQGTAGMVGVPPGTYGTFTVNGGTGLVLGVANGQQAVAYNLQNLNLNSGATIKVVSPIILTLANGCFANGTLGASNNPAWLQLQVANGGLTLNSGCTVYGLITAPNGTVIINGSSTLVGTSASSQFTLNSGGLVKWAAASSTNQTVQPPVANSQAITLSENSSTNVTLSGSDPQGLTLSYSVLSQPTHGTLSGTPPSLAYRPATNYIGTDAFTFNVSDGVTNSAAATISLVITQVYYLPVAYAQSLTNLENASLPITLTGSDPQGYALTYSVVTPPAHGSLSGTAPNLTYLPATNYYGSDSFTFRVNDGVSNSPVATISLTNRPVDYPPLVVAGPNQTIILPIHTVSLSGTVSYANFPGTVDTILWSLVSGPGLVSFSNPSNAITTASFSTNGVYRLRLFATDSYLSGSNDLYVVVDAPPSVNAGANQTNTFPGSITLNGAASDDGLPTNGVLSTSWSLVSGPGTVVFGDLAATNSAATFSTNGIYVVRLTASDGIATNHAEVTIVENLPPVVGVGANILTNGLQAAISGAVSDDGLPGGALATQWSQASGPGTIAFANASATNTSVTASQSGTYVLVLTANDGAATNSAELVVTFNLPPVVDAGAAQTVNFGVPVTLAGTATDDQLPHNVLNTSWSELSGPGTATFASAALTNTTVTFDQSGFYQLLLEADDGYATNASTVVIGVNAPPAVNAGPNQTVALGVPTALAGAYSDDGVSGSPVTVQWVQVSGPAAAAIANPAVTNTTATFSQPGTYVLELDAKDGMTNGSAQVTITVDQAPAVTVAAPSLINWPMNQATLAGTVTDEGVPMGGTLTASWSQVSGPAAANLVTPVQSVGLNDVLVSIPSSTQVTFSVPGAYVFRLTGDDGLGASHADLIVTVNQAPMVNAGTNRSVVLPANQIVLQGTATDDGLPTGSALTTSWSQVSGPGAVSFGNAGMTNTTASFSTNGLYVLQLTASDGASSNSSTMAVTVDQGPAVALAVPVIITWPSNQLTLDGIVTDDGFPTGGTLIATWSSAGGPGAVSFSPVTGSNTLAGVETNLPVSTTATFSAPGLYQVTLTAKDGLATASSNVTVTVNAVPVVIAGADQTVTLDTGVALAGTATDDGLPVGAGLVVTWSVVSGPGNVTFGDSSVTNTTASFDQEGTYVLQLSANDSLANSSATVTITVQSSSGPPNQAPSVSAGGTQVSLFPNSVVMAGSASDDGLPVGALNTTWSVISGPGTVTFDDATLQNATATFSQPGIYVLQLTASDTQLSSSQQVTVIEDTAPTVDAGSDQAVAATNHVALLGTVTDDRLPPGAPSTAQWGVVSGPGAVTFTPLFQTNALAGTNITYQVATTATFSQPGMYVLSLTADDSFATNSATVAISITQGPVLSFTSPADGDQFGTDQPIPIQLTATDDDGQVTNVTIYGDGMELVQLPADPFNFQWTNTSVGAHVLTATATDDQGVTVAASNLTVYVVPPQSGDFTVSAGPDQVVELAQSAVLNGSINISTPIDGATTNVSWSKVSGPGEVTFSDSHSLTTSAQFSQTGTYTLWLTVGYGDGSRTARVNVNVVPNSAGRLTSAKSNKGTDFWLTKLYRGYSSSDASSDWYILISSETDADIQVISYLGYFGSGRWSTNFVTVKAGTIQLEAISDLGDAFFGDNISDTIANDAIHVLADAPVTVYGFVRDIATADGYLSLPTSFLGTNYMVMSYYGASGFALVATEDNTTVTIVPSSDIDANHLAGQPWQFSMQAGESYRVETYPSDYTGTAITADKPIAVFGGGISAYIPTNYPYSDYLIEQMTPVETWGQHFATMPLATRLIGDTFRFVAAQDDTKVAVNGSVVADLDKGQFFEQLISGPSTILSSHPVMVAQFANGTTFDNVTGDPFMMLVPPVEQYGGSYMIDAVTLDGIRFFWEDPTLDYASYMNLIVLGTPTNNSVLLNDVPISPDQFQPIGNSGYFGAQLAVSNTTYRISSTLPAGVCVYGWAPYESYAFMGGAYSDVVDPNMQLTLSQTTPYGAVGADKTVVAHVVSGWGKLEPDLQVQFSVNGVNPVAGQATTTRFGDAYFTWTGTNAGDDIVTATVGNFQQSLTSTWIVATSNTPPVVIVSNTIPTQYSLTLQLSGSVYDSEQSIGNGLYQHWDLLSGPGDVVFDNASNAQTTVTCTSAGLYTFVLEADDPQFSTRSLVTVRADLPPSVQFFVDETAVLTVGTPIQLTANGSDPDDGVESIAIYVDGVEVGMDTNGYNCSVSWTPVTNGWHQIQAFTYDHFGGVAASDVYTVEADYAPVVAIDNIQNGTVVTVPTNVLIHAAASDPDGSIVSLTIYANGQQVVTTNGPDVSGIWFPQQGGDYSLTAVATDDLGISTTSDPITVTVTGDFPQVTVDFNTTNAFGEAYIAATFGVPVNIQAEAMMNGPYYVTNVTFTIQGYSPVFEVEQFSLSQSPYAFMWTPDTTFSILTVVAEANSGAIGTATTVIDVRLDVSLAFASPTSSRPVVVGTPVPLRLAVHDPGNIVALYDYYVDGQLLAETNTADPVIWYPASTGDHQLHATATDRVFGRAFWSADTTVTVIDPPIGGVSIVRPQDGDTNYPGVSMQISVDVDDPQNAFDYFEVFANGVSAGTTTNDTLVWAAPQINDYVLTAVAYDIYGDAYAATNAVMVHIVPPPPPTVDIISPEAGSTVQVNKQLGVVAELNDPGYVTTNLQFFVDGVEASDGDINFYWTPARPGTHSLQVIAFGMNGTTATSAPVNVTVATMDPPAVSLISPLDQQIFVDGQLILASAQASSDDATITNLSIMVDSSTIACTNDGAISVMLPGSLAPGSHTILAYAVDSYGQDAYSSSAQFFVGRGADPDLPVPSGLVAAAISSSSIQLTWPTVAINDQTKGILIERWNAAQTNWVELAEVTPDQTGYTDSSLNSETFYKYHIACLDTNGAASAFSNESGATTRTAVPELTVIDLSQAIGTALSQSHTGGNVLTNAGLENFDLRRAAPFGTQSVAAVLGANAGSLLQAVARFKEKWPQVQLDFDPVLLSPKSILPRSGFLTGPGGSGVSVAGGTAALFDPADPYRPVKAFVQEHEDLFGFDAEAISNAVVQREYVSPVTGARTVIWQQQVAGIPVFNSLFIGTMTATGELANVACEFIPSPETATDPVEKAAVEDGDPLPVMGMQAVLTAVTNVGDVLDFSDFSSQSNPQGATQSQSFTAGRGFKQGASAELTWFPAGRNQLKLAWQVLFTSEWRSEMYLTVVSASYNQVLYRRNLTADESDPSYRVFTDASPAPMLPGLPVPGTTQAPLVDRTLITLSALDTNASLAGWAFTDNQTHGNNVDAHLDRDDDGLADSLTLGNPFGVFDFSLDLTNTPDTYGDAAVTQVFYWDNWMHDVLYGLGFTELAGNFQSDNFGRGGLGNDAVQASVQDGLNLFDGQHRNNANMSTPPDGNPPTMRMYVFDGVTPARDGGLDGEIVLHEYTHGLSSRLVGGGAGIEALQTAGMGEGWSDFYALSVLVNPTNDVNATYPLGAYVTYHGFGSDFEQNYYYGVRHYPYCTDTNKNPLTFADIDPSRTSSHASVPRSPLFGTFDPAQANEVHGQGEVWCSMLWEVRANLIDTYGSEIGNALALHLVTDGMKLSPANPNFVQARDAILLADRIYSGGANATLIWNAFAKRGLGFDAQAPESYTTTGAHESYSLQPVLAADQVEIQTASGAIELGDNNTLLIHLHNFGNTAATHVTANLATAVTGVALGQSSSAYADIPAGADGVNSLAFQLQTTADFVNGTPIDLALTIIADQSTSTNYLRLYTGTPGVDILVNNYTTLANAAPASPAPKDLTPFDIGHLEPLWMSADASCLLRADAGRYVLWRMTGDPIPMVNQLFVAHRLTWHGVVVGQMQEDSTFDSAGDTLFHSHGAMWTPGTASPVAVTASGNAYRFPKDCTIYQNVGTVYDLMVPSPDNWLGFVSTYPTLQDAWDMDSSGTAVGAATVYVQPLDANHDGTINRTELEFSLAEQHEFSATGAMDGLAITERGANAGTTFDPDTQVNYNAMLTTAAQFDLTFNYWRWLGPVNFSQGTSLYSTALLANDVGTIAGYGAIQAGFAPPTHAFRITGNQEFVCQAPIVQDIGVLSGGSYSFPRAMSRIGEVVGYSQYQPPAGLPDYHGVYWSLTDNAPEDLRSLQQVNPSDPPTGYSDAFAINDQRQIVGTSYRASDGASAAVIWQYNHNLNATPFWEITDLNTRLTDNSWYVLNAVGINNDGLILAEGINQTSTPTSQSESAKHSLLLAKIQIAVDANRDEAITFDDADKTSQAKPYRFWLNDNEDVATSDWKWSELDPEVYDNPTPDCNDQVVNSPRDCEDLTRLWIDTGNLVNYLSSGGNNLYLGLKWENVGSGSPSIRLFPSADPDGALGHLKNVNIAAQQADPHGQYAHCLVDADYPTDGIDQVQPTGRVADFIFTKSALAGLSSSQSVLHLLFEGVNEGKGELRLVLLKKNSDGSWALMGEGPGIWLNLENIRKMYLRAYSTPLPDKFPLPWQKEVADFFTTTPYVWRTDGSVYIPDSNLGYGLGSGAGDPGSDQNQYPFDAPPDEQKKCVVFVHGIDLDVQTQLGYAQHFFKRLWWAGYRGRFAAFRWATTLDEGIFTLSPAGSHPNFSIFNSGEYRSWYAGLSLKQYVDSIRSQMGNDAVISVAGHSLGNACVGQALRVGMQVDSYVPMEAAVSLSCYYDQAGTPPVEKSLVDRDASSPTPALASNLGYQGYLFNISDNVPNLFSFYNAMDFWLITGTTSRNVVWDPVNWIHNELSSKPDDRLGLGEYKAQPTLHFERGPRFTRPVTDPIEAMSYIARSRTRPLGAIAPAPIFSGGINMLRVYGFDFQRSCHSGQFQRNIQLMYGDFSGTPWAKPFYKELMSDLRVSP